MLLRAATVRARRRARGAYSLCQSLGGSPACVSSPLVCEKWRQPKKPRAADKPEGWGDCGDVCVCVVCVLCVCVRVCARARAGGRCEQRMHAQGACMPVGRLTFSTWCLLASTTEPRS